MRVVIQAPRLVVIDDFLPPRAFTSLRQSFGSEPFKLVHVPEVQSVFRPGDGNPLDGSAVMKMSGSLSEYGRKGRSLAPEDLPFFLYPTGKPIDLLLNRVAQIAGRFGRVLGREGRDWVSIQGKPFIYPVGAGLGWHDDDRVYASAFAYYAHPSWDPDWGGELFVASGVRLGSSWKRDMFTDPREKEALLRDGFGTYILPKPNRMVFLKGGTFHRITPVTMSAGSNLRASVAGFFVTKVGLRNLLAR